MPRSRPPALSRRHFLASAAAVAAAAAGCTDAGQGDPAAGEATAAGPGGPALRPPSDLEIIALTGLRRPGSAEPVTVTVRGSRILEVGERPPVDVPVRDLGSGVVIPGFVDCHVHLQFADPAAITAGGVTTVRDLGGPPSAAQAIRDALPVAEGPAGTVGPRILLAGRILTAVGGYPSRSWGADGTARQVTGPQDAAAAVAEQLAAGATVVKLALEDGGGTPVLDLDTTTAIVAAARAAGLRTTAHVGSAALLEQALAAGVDELAHLPLHDVTPAEMAAVGEAGLTLCPTLAIRGGDPGGALAAFREAGGLVLYGSDLGNGGTAPGIMVEEVRALLDAGMTPAEVLRAATSDPAAHLGLDVGEIREGSVADLVVLGGDPFEDPAAYDDVRLVLLAGRDVT